MSRIHEALKKAEMERALQSGANSPGPRVAEQAAGPAAARSGAPAAVCEARTAGLSEAAKHFTFEELRLLRQTHAEWVPEPHTDVFSQGGHASEQFRTLRSRLYHLRNGQPLKTVLVTSSMAGEGKTFVTGNLARALARQLERRVLVIDADLRRPRLHQVFGAPETPGLTDFLRGSCGEAAIVQFGGSGNLCFIPSGTRVNEPSELLSNGRMKTLLDRIGPAFDWVVIDSPPCLPVADAGVIANWCDGLLLVVRAEFTPSAVLAKARQELKGRNVAGVVLNAVADDSLGYALYYGGYQEESAAGAAR